MKLRLYTIIAAFVVFVSFAYGSDITEQMQKKAGQGDKMSQLLLGYVYEKGDEGIKQDYKKAFEWYTKAAAQGEPLAQTRLGFMYYNGNGVKKDYAKAFEWFTKAGKQGSSDAQAALGMMYYNGSGVKKDNQKAAEWLTKSARQGHSEAKNMIGTMYANGELETGKNNTSSSTKEDKKLSSHFTEETSKVNAAQIDKAYDDILNAQSNLIQILDQSISDTNDITQMTKESYQGRGYSF